MAHARNNPNGLLALGVGGALILILWKRWRDKQETEQKASFDALVTAAIADAQAVAEKIPAAGAAPQGAGGANGAPGPGEAPFVPPGQDTNLWWWPEKKIWVAKRNGAWDYVESGVRWATGAEEGEGYFPDDWSFGTKEKIKESAIEGAKTGVDMVTDPLLPDKPIVPHWVIPFFAVSAVGLTALWILRR